MTTAAKQHVPGNLDEASEGQKIKGACQMLSRRCANVCTACRFSFSASAIPSFSTCAAKTGLPTTTRANATAIGTLGSSGRPASSYRYVHGALTVQGGRWEDLVMPPLNTYLVEHAWQLAWSAAFHCLL